MANRKHIKKWLIHTTWILVCIGVIILLGAAMKKNKNSICTKIEVQIEGGKENNYFTEKDILELLHAREILHRQSIGEIDIKALEKNLQQNLWVKEVQLFFDKAATLHVVVKQREPILRVIRKNGTSFYLDRQKLPLPISLGYANNVPVFTGFSDNASLTNKDSVSIENLVAMATYINEHSFWKAQIQQIRILPNDAFEMTPTIGTHLILFGDTNSMDKKFQKLYRFYKTVSTKVGFDKFAILNLQFNNQIVATNNNQVSIDTLKANQAIQLLMQSALDTTVQLTDTGVANSNNNAKDTAVKRNQQGSVSKKPNSNTAPVLQAPVKRNKPPVSLPKPKATMPKKPVVVQKNKTRH